MPIKITLKEKPIEERLKGILKDKMMGLGRAKGHIEIFVHDDLTPSEEQAVLATMKTFQIDKREQVDLTRPANLEAGVFIKGKRHPELEPKVEKKC